MSTSNLSSQQAFNNSAKKLYIKTQGCQMNEYDSGKMADMLNAFGHYELTDAPEKADVLLLNTCSIREKAAEKVFSELGRWRLLKQQNPDIVIGVGGCVASQEGDNIVKRAPFVDLVFGPQTLHRLPALLKRVKNNEKNVVDVSFPEIEKFDALPPARAEGPAAFVSIMEGCSKYCSYCVVPYTRGEEISRPLDDVLAEVATLVEQGVREITFLGQNVNDYQGRTFEGGIADLAALIEYSASLEGVKRLRYTTSHPVAFSDRLIQAYCDIPKLANHLHLPVQSGSDRILALMKRGYTALEYKARLRKLKQVRPTICISSDFIVGFPGETESDFQQTLDLIKTVGFDYSFSFIYSPRPGTPAADLPDDTPMAVKKERLGRLQALINAQAMAISQAMIGTTQSVVVTSLSKKNPREICGRTENNRMVNFQGPTELVGQLVNVMITDAPVNTLRGRLVD